MAEYLFNRRAQALGLGWQASSAGILAADEPMSPGALKALAARGIDGRAHRARPLSPALMAGADLVICMGESHRQALLRMFPTAQAELLCANDISDPYGYDQSIYDRTLGEIEEGIEALIQRLKARASKNT